MTLRKNLMLSAAIAVCALAADSPARVAAMQPAPPANQKSKNFTHARETRTPKAVKKAAKKARQKAWIA